MINILKIDQQNVNKIKKSIKYQPINIITGQQTADEEIYKPERIQARTTDLLLAFAVDADDQMKNCASLYSI